MGNCFVKSEESSCATALGTCKNKNCASSCSKKVHAEAVEIEAVVDAMLKDWVENHLHKYLKDHLPPVIATEVENTLIKAIDIDIVSRKSASEKQ